MFIASNLFSAFLLFSCLCAVAARPSIKEDPPISSEMSGPERHEHQVATITQLLPDTPIVIRGVKAAATTPFQMKGEKDAYVFFMDLAAAPSHISIDFSIEENGDYTGGFGIQSFLTNESNKKSEEYMTALDSLGKVCSPYKTRFNTVHRCEKDGHIHHLSGIEIPPFVDFPLPTGRGSLHIRLIDLAEDTIIAEVIAQVRRVSTSSEE